ncbi:MAG: replication factor C large subunit [Candidatus Aenigmatarchaeota archaeon]|nr:replication factor C large subunit [Candidatus Aenigmarchaeota archaeon]
MWAEKYKPKSIKDFVGKDIHKFVRKIQTWKPGNKPILISGPPGVGKTSVVYAYANDNRLDVIEINASDNRTSSQIKQIIGSSMNQMSLTKKGKIFLIDEIDGLSKEDKQATTEFIKLIKNSKFPIVFTANNPWEQKIIPITYNSDHIKFGEIPKEDIIIFLKRICKNENIEYDEAILNYISSACQGDLRKAIEVLERISIGNNKISIKSIKRIDEIEFKEKQNKIEDSLKIIFKTSSCWASRSAINNIDEDLEKIFWYIEQNIPNAYEKIEEIAQAFKNLSRADMFLTRVQKNQEYKLLRYFIDLMTAGVSISKKIKYNQDIKYEYPEMIKFRSRNKQNISQRNQKISGISSQLHCSSRKIRLYYLPYFKSMVYV